MRPPVLDNCWVFAHYLSSKRGSRIYDFGATDASLIMLEAHHFYWDVLRLCVCLLILRPRFVLSSSSSWSSCTLVKQNARTDRLPPMWVTMQRLSQQSKHVIRNNRRPTHCLTQALPKTR